MNSKSSNIYENDSDLSGPITQNRFKYQRYWSINKIYELYSEKKDFIIFFENNCDADVKIDEKWHFYQLKTNSQSYFNVNKLITIKKNNKDSILSKLSLLEKNKDNVETLSIVSNASLKEKTKFKEICLDSLNPDEKAKIIIHIDRTSNFKINLSKYFYIKSDLLLDSSYEILLANTVKFLENEFKIKETRPTTFLDWLIRISNEKSSYEYLDNDDRNTEKNKGFTKKDFLNLINVYESNYLSFKKIIGNIMNFLKTYYSPNIIFDFISALKEITRINLNSEIIIKSLEYVNKILLNNKNFFKSKNYNHEFVEEIFKKIKINEFYFSDTFQIKILIIIKMEQILSEENFYEFDN